MSGYNNQNSGNKRGREQDFNSGGNGGGYNDRNQHPRNGPTSQPGQQQQSQQYGGYHQQEQGGQGGQYAQQQGGGGGGGNYQQGGGRGGGGGGNYQQQGGNGGGGGGPFGGGFNGVQGGRGGAFDGRGGGFGGRGGDNGGRGGSGGRDAGRGRGGGGRGGPHMGLNSALISAVKSSDQCGDAAALLVISPSEANRDRSTFHGQTDGPERFFPTLTSQRLEGSAGLVLASDDHVVRANHFLVDGAALPDSIYQYSVSIVKVKRDQTSADYDQDEDLCLGKVDRKHNLTVLKALRDKHPEWSRSQQGPVGVTYDGGAALFTSRPLSLPQSRNQGENESHAEKVFWPGSSTMQFTVAIMFVAVVAVPKQGVHKDQAASGMEWGDICHRQAINALDVALFSFARWEEGVVLADDQRPSWILNGTKAFQTSGTSFQLSPAFVGLLGYHASLKACISGLVLVADISVTCFLTGGHLVDIMVSMGGYRNVGDMVQDSRGVQQAGQTQGLGAQRLSKMEEILKGVKVTLRHIKHSKKFRSFGPAANSTESCFKLDNGESTTVADYYTAKAASDPQYAAALPSGRLQYPHFPTVNMGSKKRHILVPVELVRVNEGQTRQRSMTGDISSKIIKHAAMLPNDRAAYLRNTNPDGLKYALANDEDVRSFGLDAISGELMRIHSTVLCPAKLQYGNRVVEPLLTGTWNLAGGISFAKPAPAASNGAYKYCVLVVYGGNNEPRNFEGPVHTFQEQIEKESLIVGIPLVRVTAEPMLARGDSGPDLGRAFAACKDMNPRIVVVVLMRDLYNQVKYHADALQLSTQCLQWKNVEKAPRGYHTNVLMKMNAKMGGINHTMATRGRVDPGAQPTFQSPPQSLSWLLDELCMVVGVDIAHPDPSSPSAPSVAAVVASMDGSLGQYCAHISTCTARTEVVSTLETAMAQLLTAFRDRNKGQMPKHMIVYRDGVADNQFQEVLDTEVPAFKNAIMLLGFEEASVAISVVICQKRHHTRLLYENKDGQFENPCVGLCTDAHSSQSTTSRAFLQSISSPSVLEFYLNSHLAVLGTSKPCKYSLIHDEIGFKLSELELLTYWTTHLYCRCTRSVSYATPAYYAHWAARRGKALLMGGAAPGDLSGMSNQWLAGGNTAHNTMYFI